MTGRSDKDGLLDARQEDVVAGHLTIDEVIPFCARAQKGTYVARILMWTKSQSPWDDGGPNPIPGHITALRDCAVEE